MGLPVPHAGRPRDPRLDDALMRAALDVFIERGYHGATLAEIARRAHVGTPALYRRWPTKADLAIDIVLVEARPEPIPETGSIRDDLAEFMRIRLESGRQPVFRHVMLPVAIEAMSDSALSDKVRATFLGYREPLADRIGRSIASGELRDDTDPHRIIDLLMGTVIMPVLFSLEVPADSEATSIVDRVLDGFARRANGNEAS